jgi:hypothetical protein
MANLYFKLNFSFTLYATDKEDKKELEKKGEKKVDHFVLTYKGGANHREANYGIYIHPSEFLKGAEISFDVGSKVEILVNGIAKISPKADLYQYLMEDKEPQFFFHHLHMDPYADLYADKKQLDVPISCSYSKSKP